MQVKVLGTIVVFAPDEVSLGGPTRRRTLAVLAMHANEVVSVDQLVDAVWWPSIACETAGRNLTRDE